MSKFIREKEEKIILRLPLLIQEGKTCKEIIEILHISKSAVFRHCSKLGLTIPNYHNSLKFDNTVFDSIDTEEKAYWLGFLYADGNVHSNINMVSISLKDSDYTHLEKFKTFLCSNTNIKHSIIKVNNKDYRICKLSVCNKHLKERLIELGCPPRKSLILKFPNPQIFSNDSLIYDFIRGYIDGDGCLTFSKNGRLELSIIGTCEFLKGITMVFPNRFKSIQKIKRLKTNVWKISNCGENADFVTKILYKNATIYLERKYNRFAVLNRNI